MEPDYPCHHMVLQPPLGLTSEYRAKSSTMYDSKSTKINGQRWEVAKQLLTGGGKRCLQWADMGQSILHKHV